MNKLLKIMLVVGCITLCSCSDEEFESVVQNPTMDSDLKSTAQFTPSYCNIWDINSLDERIIQLESDAPVKAYDTSGIFNFEQRSQTDGTSVLVAKLKSGAKLGDGLIDEVIISSKADEEQFQVVTLIIRDDEPLAGTRAVDPTAMKNRVAEYFSRAYQLWGDVGYTPAKPALKPSLLIADSLLLIESASESKYFQTTGSSIDETTTAHSYNFGLGGSGPIGMGPLKGFMLGGTLSGKVSKKQRNRDEFEYILGTKEFRAASANLHTDRMKVHGYLYYVDNVLNEVLNNKSSELYRQYSNDTTGIYNLLDAYGSYIATGGTLGASFNYLFYRKRVVSDYSIEWQLAATLDLKKKAEAAQAAGQKLSSDSIKKLAAINGYADLLTALSKVGITPVIGDATSGSSGTEASNFNANFGTEHSYANYMESTEAHHVLHTFGGNSNELPQGDYGKFVATDDPAKWAIINYNFQSNGIQQKAKFIPLYEFCKEDSRRAALIKALTPQPDSVLGITISPYFATRHCDMVSSPKKNRIVIADFQPYYQDFGTKNHTHVPGQPKPIVMQGPDGKYRTYYPLMANPLIYEGADAGYAFNPHSYQYTSHMATINTNMLFYYALDYADQCAGILDIGCYKDGAQPRGWIKRGHATDKDTKGSFPKYIYVKLADIATDENQKITGIGVYAEKQNGIANGPWASEYTVMLFAPSLSDMPIASTGGTEFARPWHKKEVEYFQDYWPAVKYNSNFSENRIFNARTFTPQLMWLGTTKKSIVKRCTYEYKIDPKTGTVDVLKPEICHPLPW